MVSSTFIKHNRKGKSIAEVKWHRDHETFCVREHPNGGYILLVKQGKGFLPMQIEGDTQLIVSTKRDGSIACEFIRVKHPIVFSFQTLFGAVIRKMAS